MSDGPQLFASFRLAFQHTLEDVKYTIKAFKNVAEKLAKGEYNKELLIDASKL